jgi:hypothetical protein
MDKNDFGALSITSTDANILVLVANLVALLSPIAFVLICTALKPANYQFPPLRAIAKNEPNDLKRGNT